MEKSTTILLPLKRINLLVDKSIDVTSSGLGLVHQAAVQTMLHAEKHGDTGPALRLVQGLKDRCKGLVHVGMHQWFKDHSPIRMTMKEGKVEVKLLKEGDAGYKPFDVSTAEAKPALETAEVAKRTDRPIEEMSVKLLKARLKGLQDQIKKAGEKDGRGYFGATPEEKIKTKTQCETLMSSVLATVDKINFLGPVANAVEAATGTPDRKSRSRSRAKTVAEAAAGTESQVKAA